MYMCAAQSSLMNMIIKIFGGVAHVSFFLKVNQLTKERIFHFEATTGSSNTDPGKVEAYSKAKWLKLFQFLVIFQ